MRDWLRQRVYQSMKRGWLEYNELHEEHAPQYYVFLPLEESDYLAVCSVSGADDTRRKERCALITVLEVDKFFEAHRDGDAYTEAMRLFIYECQSECTGLTNTLEGNLSELQALELHYVQQPDPRRVSNVIRFQPEGAVPARRYPSERRRPDSVRASPDVHAATTCRHGDAGTHPRPA